MKQIILSAFLMTFLTLFSSCDKEISRTSDIIVDTNWKLSSFIEGGVNQTDSFKTFNYDFTNIQLHVNTGPSVISGTWVMTQSGEDISLIIDFSSSEKMKKWNKLWLLAVSTREKMVLQHVNANGELDTVIFTQ